MPSDLGPGGPDRLGDGAAQALTQGRAARSRRGCCANRSRRPAVLRNVVAGGGQRQILIARQPVPGSLVEAQTLAAAPVSHRDFADGRRSLDIDREKIIALATDTPLWRPLERDMRGADVAALQKELARLGYDVRESGVMDWSTRFAAADFLGMDDGDGGVPDSIPRRC